MSTSMLLSNAFALSEDMVSYAGRGPIAVPDEELYGLGALYRLYPTAAGWIFLAAPAEADWAALVDALGGAGAALGEDPRFATAALRKDADAALAEALTALFATDEAAAWEQRLLAADVGCVVAGDGPVEAPLQSQEFGGASGLLATVEDPTFGTIPRLAPLVALSRTPGTVGPAPSLGQHTDQVLGELGFSAADITGLRARGIVAGAPAP
jgi:crotonobetainyl-CoA:carnitine CoA-transferase CaiB-like acyl-CoA transferase